MGKYAILAAALWLLSSVALAAEYEVRLPVEKTTRMTPAGELSNETAAPQAKKAQAKKPDAKTPEAAKPEKAPATAASKTQKPAGPAPETAEAPAPKPTPAPAPKPAPKPKPEPRIDPKALELPPAQAGPRTTTPLPASGQWVGDVDVEFQADRVVLRVATTGEVERVTWFNLVDPKEPRKLAMDLRGGWHKKGGPVARFETGPLVSVVTGEHPDRLRLSVEFRDGAVKPDVAPVVEKGPHSLTLTIPLAVRLK